MCSSLTWYQGVRNLLGVQEVWLFLVENTEQLVTWDLFNLGFCANLLCLDIFLKTGDMIGVLVYRGMTTWDGHPRLVYLGPCYKVIRVVCMFWNSSFQAWITWQPSPSLPGKTNANLYKYCIKLVPCEANRTVSAEVRINSIRVIRDGVSQG